MKIQYISDLHLEFDENYKWATNTDIPANGDILIMAGDIVTLAEWEFRKSRHEKFFEQLSQKFETVYWLPGNHEYYRSDLSEFTGSFKKAIFPNLFLLNNQVIKYPGTRVIFTTLWSKIERENAEAVYYGMSDFRLIRSETNKLTVGRYNELFNENFSFLKDALMESFNGKTIVVTHHVPTQKNYPEQYKDSTINNGFVTELEPFIKDADIDYWIYGHHHQNVEDFFIGKTKLLTNQCGYIHRQECLDFDFGKWI